MQESTPPVQDARPVQQAHTRSADSTERVIPVNDSTEASIAKYLQAAREEIGPEWVDATTETAAPIEAICGMM